MAHIVNTSDLPRNGNTFRFEGDQYVEGETPLSLLVLAASPSGAD